MTRDSKELRRSSMFDRFSTDGRSTVSARTTETSFSYHIDKHSLNLLDESLTILDPSLTARANHSQYEPVNSILSRLQNDKLTLLSLNKNRSSEQDLNDKILSYCQYWRIKDDNYKVLNMLEPELVKEQTQMFRIFQYTKSITFQLQLLVRNYFPLVFKHGLLDIDPKIQNTIFNSYQQLYILFHSLYCELSETLHHNIVVQRDTFKSILSHGLCDIDDCKETFIHGVAEFSDRYDDIRRHLSHRSIDLGSHIAPEKLNFKLAMFNSIIPLEVSNLCLRAEQEKCESVMQALNRCKHLRMTKRLASKRRRELVARILDAPSELGKMLIFLPFIFLCWTFFAMKRLVCRASS